MGTSTDAYIYFGFDFHNSEDSEDYYEQIDKLEEGGWEDLYCEKMSIVDDSEFWTKEGTYTWDEHTTEYDEANKKYNEYRDKCKDLLKPLVVEIDTHCSGEDPIYFVSLKRISISANRGYPQRIDPNIFGTFNIEKEEIQAMKDFCKIMEIPWKKPMYYLASYWG